ncbi:unnamed protein product [Paramecium pentaurelia]|uniref:Uncharacterized protein n=1 Tax=Paramecium pentaurelia TaxID=43138 RepID=A0A8S1VZ22_9CILI|nr:unnamed protein product [Paramecium pentaurelia]
MKIIIIILLFLSNFIYGNFYLIDIYNAQQQHSIPLFQLNLIFKGCLVNLLYSQQFFDEQPSQVPQTINDIKIFCYFSIKLFKNKDQIKQVLSVQPINEQIPELIQLTNNQQLKQEQG